MAPIVIDAPLSDSIRNNKKYFKKPHGNKSTNGIQKRFGGAGKPFGVRKSLGFQNGKENQNVEVKIANLAPTVTLDDLQELFSDFKSKEVSINANGTGSVTLPQKDAFQLMNKFRGVAIDDIEMRFSMSISSRVCFPGPVPKSQKRGSYRKSSGAAKKNAKAQKKQEESPQRKMTTEELDAALDAYIS